MTNALICIPEPEDEFNNRLADAAARMKANLIRRARALGGLLGGRPYKLANPDTKADILKRYTEGESISAIARAIGVSPTTVARFIAANQDAVQEMQQAIQVLAAEKVLGGIVGATQAQLEAASNPECRHGPQALRAVAEVAGVIGKPSSIHIGDNIDARSVNVSLERPVSFDKDEHDKLRSELGL